MPLSQNATRKARRAYRAAVTGMDRKLGKLLAELDALKLRGSTAEVSFSKAPLSRGVSGPVAPGGGHRRVGYMAMYTNIW